MKQIRAFTLIELILVFALIALIAGMVMAGMGPKGNGVHVRPAAEELAGVLRRARSLALSTQLPHAVVFNITNAAGGSGRVLNNLGGGHWYRILGPAPTGHDLNVDAIPVLNTKYWSDYPNFGDFLTAIDACWVGEAHALPAGKVRFLALSDTDEGGRMAHSYDRALVPGLPRPPEAFYASSGESPNTYPRPWFGYFDPATRRLHAWGGYDPDNAQTRPFAGFYFQGGLMAIPDGCNPADKTIVWYENPASRSYFDQKDGSLIVGASRKTRTILKAGEPRPLVNAAWRDASIVFLPDGRARMLAWNEARARYYDCDPVQAGRWVTHASSTSCPNWGGVSHPGWSWDQSQGDGCGAGGLATYQGILQSDLVPPRPVGATPCPGPPPGSVAGNFNFSTTGAYNPAMSMLVGGTWSKVRSVLTDTDRSEEVGSFSTHTGGWFFTLAPDVSRERVEAGVADNQFASADEALRSMLPAIRVFVSKAGMISIVQVKRREDTLDALTTWPPAGWSGGYWDDVDTTFNQNDLAMHARYGWLHQSVTQAADGKALRPRGVPIVRTLSTTMLTERIWWVDQPDWVEP